MSGAVVDMYSWARIVFRDVTAAEAVRNIAKPIVRASAGHGSGKLTILLGCQIVYPISTARRVKQQHTLRHRESRPTAVTTQDDAAGDRLSYLSHSGPLSMTRRLRPRRTLCLLPTG